MKRAPWFLCAVSVSTALLACGPDKPAPKSADEVKAKPVETAETSKDAGATSFKPLKDPALNVSDDIQRACNLQDPGLSPKFDYDSADVSDAEKNLLGQIARCLTTGPLKGKSVMLTGRADARGEQEYNMSLGHNRAQKVRGFLSAQGLGDDKMFETSRGALDATGTDEMGYAKDRRVDIELRK
jgi:peptidoglycan-associated lipoprotein